MDIVKKNIVSVVCGVVALLAVVALFWPISGYYADLQARADERKQVYSSMAGLLNKERLTPAIGLDQTQRPLTQFPTQPVIDKYQEVVEQVTKQATAMFDAALKLNARKPLVEGALPEGSSGPSVRFQQIYQAKFDFMSLDERRRNESFPVAIMKAGFPPTPEQIQLEQQRRTDQINAKIARGYNGEILNQDAINAELATEIPKVAQRMTAEAAEKCLVYIEPDALDPHPMLINLQGSGGFVAAPVPSVVFNGQVGLWIHEDVASAIAAANSNSTKVSESIVKHLIKIDLTEDFFRADAMPVMGPDGMAPVVNPDPTADVPKNYTLTPTGRVSCGLYDIIPFIVSMNVDAGQVPRVLQELSRNKFITVTGVTMTSVDPAEMRTRGYFYGDNRPVVRLDLQCESLMLRRWTEPLMPLRIKQSLGIVPMPQQPGM